MDLVLHLTVRVLLALLFGVAAAHKLRDPAAFRATFADYRLAPAWCAWLVILAELAVVATLCVPGALGPIAAATMLGGYAAAIAVNLVRGRRDIDCGCAGPARRRLLSWSLVTRNVTLAAVALIGLVPLHARPLHWVDAVTLVAATLTASALYAAADRLGAPRTAA
jgi:hypothetical protein